MSLGSFEVRSPSDGRLLAELPVQERGEVGSALERARVAQRTWGARDAPDRARGVRRLAEVLALRSAEIAERIGSETGKPRTEALAEVVVSVDLLRFVARVAPRRLRARRVGTAWMLGKSAWVEREPYGVVGVITPWNYPFILAMDAVAPGLAAGNALLIKPSELTPLTTLLLPELCRDAGLSEGLVQVITGDGRTGQALVEAGVDRIVFTGSTATGKKIMAAAAATLTPVTLELGGKDPAVVLADADLERSAHGVVFGAFFNAGQTCISIERVYVARPIYDPFVARVVELTNDLRAGTGPDVDLGPMVAEAQVRIVERHVADALARGARVLTGGRRLAPGSRVFLPTVLVDVDPSMEIVRDETFGPVLPIMRVEDEDDAVRQANELRYGLCASVWSGDRARGLSVARRLRAGGVSVNDVLGHYGVAGLPVGGRGESGFGQRRGLEGLEEMSRARAVLLHRVGGARDPWWFPYSDRTVRMLSALLDWRGKGGTGGLLRAVRRMSRSGS